MTQVLQKLSIATFGVAVAALGSIASAVAADLSFSVSGTFAANEYVGEDTFSGTYSFDPADLAPAPDDDGTLQAKLSSYNFNLSESTGNPVRVSTDSLFSGVVRFKRVDRGTTLYDLVFSAPCAAFNLNFFATNKPAGELGVADPDYTAPPSQFLGGSFGACLMPFRYEVASATVTAASPTSVPEPGTAAALSMLGLGSWLLRKKNELVTGD